MTNKITLDDVRKNFADWKAYKNSRKVSYESPAINASEDIRKPVDDLARRPEKPALNYWGYYSRMR